MAAIMSSTRMTKQRRASSNQSPNILPGDTTRAKVIEILSATANGCLAELGYFPGMPKLLHELEQRNQRWQSENVKLFEDNRHLMEMVNNLTRKLNLVDTPSPELVNTILSLQAELNTICAQRDELLQRTGDPSQPGQLTYAQLRAEYNKILEIHQSAKLDISRLQAQNTALYAHIRQCPYAAQMSRSGIPFSQPTRVVPSNAALMPPQVHPHSNNSLQRVVHHRPTPQTEPHGSVSAACIPHQLPYTADQQRVQALPNQPIAVGGMPMIASSQIPMNTDQHQNSQTPPRLTAVPEKKFKQAMSIVSDWDAGTDQIQQVLRRAVQMTVESAATGGQPLAVPEPMSQCTQVVPPQTAMSSPIGQTYNFSSQSVASTVKRNPPSATLTTALPETSSHTDETRTSVSILCQDSEMPGLSRSSSSSSRKSSPLETNEIVTPTASRSESEALQIVSSPVLGLETMKRSNMEMSESQEAQDSKSESARKKPRMSIEPEASVVPMEPVMQPMNNPVSSGDGEEEEGDDEVVEIGPDGLRLISDCLSNIFSTDGDLKTCRLCKSRFTRGYISEEPKPFSNPTDDILVEHCIKEHEQAWNSLRNDI